MTDLLHSVLWLYFLFSFCLITDLFTHIWWTEYTSSVFSLCKYFYNLEFYTYQNILGPSLALNLDLDKCFKVIVVGLHILYFCPPPLVSIIRNHIAKIIIPILLANRPENAEVYYVPLRLTQCLTEPVTRIKHNSQCYIFITLL